MTLKQNSQGFFFIELLVGLSILAWLSVISLSVSIHLIKSQDSLLNIQKKCRVAQNQIEMMIASKQYVGSTNTQKYPYSEQFDLYRLNWHPLFPFEGVVKK